MFNRMNNRKKPLPPDKELLAEANRIFRYCKDTGNLYWIAYTNPANPGRSKLGEIVGGDDGHGYRMCAVLGHKFKVHQIVWLINKGELAKQSIDHINGDRRDNRIENLRLTTDHQNIMNMSKMRSNTCGVSRCTKPAKGKPYEAKIQYLGVKYHLGTFATVEEANEAYREARKKLSGDFSPV